jgi:membrane-bound ClpP family serine protease
MWLVAGILIGLLLTTTLAGFRTGPHTHLAAGALGAVVAAWLGWMAAEGTSLAEVTALLSADVVVSAGLGVLAWSGLHHQSAPRSRITLVGAEGVAVSDLDPEGVVRVAGEQWSVTSMNGRVPAGGRVQVIRAAGVRLEVWGEDLIGLDERSGDIRTN